MVRRTVGIRRLLAGGAALALLVPSLASSQPGPRAAAAAAAAASEEGLSTQDQQILGYAKECSAQIVKVMEGWIKSNQVSKEKLFAFLYYPIPDTDPQKFSTDYDKLSDKDIAPIQDACLARAPEIKFVVTVDKNGYLPSHNAAYSKPLTGRRALDLVNSRTKRIFNDRTGITAARNKAPYLV